MSLRQKAFITSLTIVHRDPRKAKTFLGDKRLTNQERTILASFLSLRDFENKEVIEQLERFVCQDPFVESMRLYCIGAAYNNLTQFALAESFLLKSIDLNRFDGGEVFRMGACQSLFTVYLNTHNFSGMEKVVSILKASRPSERLHINIKFCEFSLTVQQQQLDLAKSLVPAMEDTFELFNEHQSISYLYDLFELHLFDSDFDQCAEVLERLKRVKKFKNSTHVKFMQTMISFIREGKPIYLYEKDFKDFPQQLNQLICLQALERGDETTALAAWGELHKISPLSIKVPFEIEGPPTLFSRAMEKFKLSITPQVPIPKIDENLPKEEKLFYILTHSSTPVLKETIYRELWNRDVDSKDDLKKLVKVVQRAREKYSIEIQSIKGSYTLKQKKAG